MLFSALKAFKKKKGCKRTHYKTGTISPPNAQKKHGFHNTLFVIEKFWQENKKKTQKLKRTFQSFINFISQQKKLTEKTHRTQTIKIAEQESFFFKKNSASMSRPLNLQPPAQERSKCTKHLKNRWDGFPQIWKKKWTIAFFCAVILPFVAETHYQASGPGPQGSQPSPTHPPSPLGDLLSEGKAFDGPQKRLTPRNKSPMGFSKWTNKTFFLLFFPLRDVEKWWGIHNPQKYEIWNMKWVGKKTCETRGSSEWRLGIRPERRKRSGPKDGRVRPKARHTGSSMAGAWDPPQDESHDRQGGGQPGRKHQRCERRAAVHSGVQLSPRTEGRWICRGKRDTKSWSVKVILKVL